MAARAEAFVVLGAAAGGNALASGKAASKPDERDTRLMANLKAATSGLAMMGACRTIAKSYFPQEKADSRNWAQAALAALASVASSEFLKDQKLSEVEAASLGALSSALPLVWFWGVYDYAAVTGTSVFAVPGTAAFEAIINIIRDLASPPPMLGESEKPELGESEA